VSGRDGGRRNESEQTTKNLVSERVSKIIWIYKDLDANQDQGQDSISTRRIDFVAAYDKVSRFAADLTALLISEHYRYSYLQ
jgi:hypothetical protein